MNEEKNIASGLGKRKTSIAKAWVQAGTGLIILNQLPFHEAILYSQEEKERIKTPFQFLNWQTQYNLKIEVKGGGMNGQIEAIQLAIARAFCKIDPSFRLFFKKEDLLTRDSRIKERRKYGLKKARKASQYSKR